MHSELEKIANVYGDICVLRKKQRRKRQKLLVIQLMYEYAKNSTLHGLRYIVDNALNIFERVFWLITVILSLAICSYFIYNVVQKWITSPVIVAVNGRLASVGSVPFPAVTICPQVKVDPYYYNYTLQKILYDNDSFTQEDENYTRFFHVNALCDEMYNSYRDTNVTNASFIEDIMLAAPKLFDKINECKWHGQRSDVFSEVITDDGVCYTFNGLAAKDIFKNSIQDKFKYIHADTPTHGWSMEHGYKYSEEHEKTAAFFPRRGRAFGSDPDLSVTLMNLVDEEDRECNKIHNGYKIYLHHPADMPQSSLYYYAALPNQLSSLAVSFHKMDSDYGLIDYDVQVRQCYFPKDRKLRYFKIYTAKNCYAECLSNYTFKYCKCVGFAMPFHNSSAICDLSSVKIRLCMEKAKDVMAKEEREADMGYPNDDVCRCLPSCNNVEYDAEILKTAYRFDNFIKSLLKKYDSNFNMNFSFSKIDLFFKKPQFVTMQRRELFGVTDLLANIGGLLGVFLGFSFLSLVEIIYFLTVRVGFILKRDLKEEKSKQNT